MTLKENISLQDPNHTESLLAVTAENLGKCYSIYPTPADRVKQAFFGRWRKYYSDFWALQEVSFQVKKGCSYSVIGSNGSGKSTLLQILAGIHPPTTGTFSTQGRVGGLIELGAGFNPEFSGEDNARMQCALLGMSPEETDQLLPQIIDFSELGDFISKPVKTYSSGMQVRLGFSCQAILEPDILLADEVLAVGDQHFQWKCFERIRELRDKGCTILLVTHDTTAVLHLCDEVLWLDAGRVVDCPGKPSDIIPAYMDFQKARAVKSSVTPHEVLGTPSESCPPQKDENSNPQTNEEPSPAHTLPAEVISVEILDEASQPTKTIQRESGLTVRIRYKLGSTIPGCIIGIAIFDAQKSMIFGTNTMIDKIPMGETIGEHICEIHYPEVPVLNGEYNIDIGIFGSDGMSRAIYIPYAAIFTIVGDYCGLGVVHIKHAWNLLSTDDALNKPKGK